MNTSKDAVEKVAHAAESPRERRYETGVRSEFDDVTTARFVLSEADAHEILRLSALVAANELHVVKKFDYRTSWLEGDSDAFTEARSDADTINVSASEFWYSAYLKHTSTSVLTERQSISELKEWLGIQDVVKKTEAITPHTTTNRVLVVVRSGGGVAISDDGVDVHVFDWDNYKDDPLALGVPPHFADLAQRAGVPVDAEPGFTDRPRQ